MRLSRALVILIPFALLDGCGYVHFGRLPKANDPALVTAYTDLVAQRKILEQELVLAQKESATLRTALDRAMAQPMEAAPNLTRQLEDTTRELATVRARYAKLEAEKAGAAQSATALGARLATAEQDSERLKRENEQLRRDLDVARSENASLAGQLKSSLEQARDSQAAITRLNADLRKQEDARSRAEQAASALRVQLEAVMARTGRSESSSPAGAPPLGPRATLAELQRAKAPPSEPAAVVELRTSLRHVRAVAAASAGPIETVVSASAESPRPAQAAETPPAGPGASPPKAATAVAAEPRTYTVQEGDTLEKIAARVYGSADQWAKLYGANTDLLSTGQGLKPGTQLKVP
ncbi:MAG TPA: LysM peptidoglycan-binding domain-containing protein [Opitutaceae bacterium]|nr:LysM peptidoglycan-binding domain-containing protein [Opitutaceae bacterium]